MNNGSGEYMFGLTRVLASDSAARKLERICIEEGGETFVHAAIPGNETRGWFTGPNRGAPFDEDLQARVMDRVKREHPGIYKRLWGET